MGKGEKTIVIPRLDDPERATPREIHLHLIALGDAFQQLATEIEAATNERNKRIRMMSQQLIQEWAKSAQYLPSWFRKAPV